MIKRRTVLGGLAVSGLAATGFTRVAEAGPLAPRQLRPAQVVTDLPPEDLAEGEITFSTGFEDASEDWYLTDQASRTTDNPYAGDHALTIAREDASVYLTSQTELPFVPGTEYVLQARMRAENLSRTDSADGARMALEAYDAAGKWIYGRYGKGIQTEDWAFQELVFAPTAVVSGLRLTLFLTTGVTGAAYFDEVVVREAAPAPFATALISPSYRGLVIPGDHDEVRLQARLGLTEEALAKYRLRIELVSGSTVVTADEGPAEADTVFTHPATGLAAGDYQVRIALLDAAGAEVATDSWPITVLADGDPLPQRWVDRHGRLHHTADGVDELELPLGFFTSGHPVEHMELLQGTAFTNVMSYGEPTQAALDLYAEHGLQVIGSIKDCFFGEPYCPPEITSVADEVPYITALVEQYKDHPALLAWYIQDERDPKIYGDRLMDHYAAVVAADPDHPVLAVDYRRPPAHIQMRATDAFGVDNYPITGTPTNKLEQAGALAADARANLPHRMMWHVPQSFGWSAYPPSVGRPPTTEELRSMCWQYICSGATGLLLYSLHNMDDMVGDLTLEEAFGRAQTVADEIVERRDLILSVEQPPQVSATENRKVFWTTRTLGGRGHLIVVSADQFEPQEITFTAPGAVVVSSSTGRRLVPEADSSFTVTLDPLQVQWLEFPLRRG
ncbi:glycoside hydrolase 5 family protein [Parenemella sanctibonifatiensis]|uniref:CBM-cenC domain-containing protein n=1 Tax=Parenemella sanctibonifatiensis TaxID=2016505 RepID=A0A255ELY4_9ACTN|nr:hypothetical protein [Parenemella sanctibonifatiensis]OYN91991.1 hypothetical protein CGZ91_00190 [Parenemella sanctibonifatiensis]